MMISLEMYKESIKDYEMEQLIKERDRLFKEIKDFENNQIKEEDLMQHPSPIVIYQMNNEYLSIVSILINEKTDELKDQYWEKIELLDFNETKSHQEDVLVYLIKKNLKTERCWVHIVSLEDKFIVGTLLEEPSQDFGYHKGETIAFFCEKDENDEVIYICDMNPSKTLTSKDLEDGTLLKNAITAFNKDSNEENFFEILELLRDSYVWIPCNAIFDDSDYHKIAEMIEKNKDNLKDLVGTTLTNEKDIRMVPDILKNGDHYFFPVFTTCEDMGEYGRSFSKVEKHFLEAIILAKNNKINVEGIVINAFSEAFVLNREIFDFVENAKSRIIE